MEKIGRKQVSVVLDNGDIAIYTSKSLIIAHDCGCVSSSNLKSGVTTVDESACTMKAQVDIVRGLFVEVEQWDACGRN